MRQTSLNNKENTNSETMNINSAKYDYMIVGLGKTGLSCAKYLYAQGINFAIADSRDIPPSLQTIKQSMPEIELFLGEFKEQDLNKANTLLISPGVSQAEPSIQITKKKGVNIFGDIELFAQQVTKPVIAITGSNGKSTVTTLVAELLMAAGFRVKAGGNLGTPALELLDDNATDIYVLELSSFQLETVASLNPISSVVLNLSADHMDRYKDLEEYASAKSRIYQGDGCMVINQDDPYSKENLDASRNALSFSIHNELDHGYSRKVINDVAGLYKDKTFLIEESELKLKGLHNTSNILAALALVDSFNIELSIIKKVLTSFSGLAHRCEFVAQHNDVSWYNDSKGTNVGASCASIQGLAEQGQIILLAGGDAKDAEFDDLATACKGKTKAAILFGKDADKINSAIGSVVECHHTKDLEQAVLKANQLARAGDIVLLSPACASLDMFKNYEQRGEVFVNAVKKIVGTS